MSRLGIVFSHEFKETVRSKPFIIISVFFAVVIIAIGVVGIISGADDSPSGSETVDISDNILYNIALADNSESGLGQQLRSSLSYIEFDDAPGDSTQYESLLEDGIYDAVVVLESDREYACYQKFSMYTGGEIPSIIESVLTDINRTAALAELGISGSDALGVTSVQVSGRVEQVGAMNIGKYIYNYLMIILMYVVIACYGQMVATRVATEKSSRTMEVLITSASPRDLLFGKVLGVGAAGLVQLIVFVVSAFAMVKLTMSETGIGMILDSMLNTSTADLLYLCGYFILGFLFMAFIFGALGSLVSQLEDLSGTAAVPMYVFVIGYIIAVFSTSSGTSSTLLRVCSHIPLWSPVVMFSRMAVEPVQWWEIMLSLGILLVSCIAMAVISAKVYRRGMLMYGKPPKLREIGRMLKSDK